MVVTHEFLRTQRDRWMEGKMEDVLFPAVFPELREPEMAKAEHLGIQKIPQRLQVGKKKYSWTTVAPYNPHLITPALSEATEAD